MRSRSSRIPNHSATAKDPSPWHYDVGAGITPQSSWHRAFDRVGFNPSVEATAQDIGTVLDAAGSRRVVLFGASEGEPACIKFVADRPDRDAGLILFASLAKGSATPEFPHALQASQ